MDQLLDLSCGKPTAEKLLYYLHPRLRKRYLTQIEKITYGIMSEKPIMESSLAIKLW